MFKLALLPSIVLLIYIYKKDTREKEPLRLLIGLLIFGALSSIPIVIMESALTYFFEEDILTEGSLAYAIVDGFIVAGFTEELFKYRILKKKTWKSKEFNCSFDGIVYAVFVSLGFATLENILYVFDNGFGTAIVRMFTAVPGHACDAVFMGYFYSQAKKANIAKNKSLEKKYKRLALWIPILFHGSYDALISFDEAIVGESIYYWGLLLWFALVIFQFILSFRLVNKASKQDAYFIEQN